MFQPRSKARPRSDGILTEDDIQRQLLEEECRERYPAAREQQEKARFAKQGSYARARSYPGEDTEDDQEEYGSWKGNARRTFQRAWSWPVDSQRRLSLPRRWPELPGPPQPPRTSFILLMVVIVPSIAWICMGLFYYSQAAEPTVLQGWSAQCPPTWLHSTSPDMILLGYQRTYADVRPPWRDVQAGFAAYKKCWHGGDRNFLHQKNRLNISFPVPTRRGGHELTFVDLETNSKIMERGFRAVDNLTECRGLPCTPSPISRLMSRLDTAAPPPDDGLPKLGADCPHFCTLLSALKIVARAAINPMRNHTADHPGGPDELRTYCPCSLQVAFNNLRQAWGNLPLPQSVHPFYTNRNDSTLYQSNDAFSWWVWLWGNGFFSPWRLKSIDEISREELLDLYAQGFWDNRMGGKRRIRRDEVWAVRGSKPPKRHRDVVAAACDGQADWCIQLHEEN